jgi:hypothetical protein
VQREQLFDRLTHVRLAMNKLPFAAVKMVDCTPVGLTPGVFPRLGSFAFPYRKELP